jgi:uncharacterized protein
MIRRNVHDSVRRAMSDTPVVLLNGARQTGKTTLAQAIAAESEAQFFTHDDSATLALAVGDPAGFIHNLKGPVVIDEIQKAPDLFPAIKLAVDQHRQPGRFLLTGSANVMTMPRLSESLAGRMEIIPLFPFSAGELAGVGEGFLSRLFRGAIDQSETAMASEDMEVRLTRGGSVAAVEVKAGVTVAASDFAALKALRDQVGKQFRAGVVLYLGDQLVPSGDKLWLVPVSALWAP